MNAQEAAREIIDRITDLVTREEFGPDTMLQLHVLRSKYVEPLLRFLKTKPTYAQVAADVTNLQAAIEELGMTFESDPAGRAARCARLEQLKVSVRRAFIPKGDRDSEVQELLAGVRRWQWRAKVDAEGRIIFATPDGAGMPAKGEIAGKVGAQIIEQATQAEKPYTEATRPRDRRGEPGGLVVIRDGRRLVVVGDLHGQYENLARILQDRNNLARIIEGESHLVFTGDAVHPPSSLYNTDAAYDSSFAVMLLIMTLKAENPEHVHYIIGNHDNAHVGGTSVGRGRVSQDEAFETFITRKFGASVFQHYREFVMRAPVAVKANMGDGHVLLLHGTVPSNVRYDADLTDLLVEGRRSKMMHQILWRREYSEAVLDRIRETMGVRLVVSGHTTPNEDLGRQYGLATIMAHVFAHYHHKQIIVNAQSNQYGYLDLDLTRNMPDKVTKLRAPGDLPAFRVFSRSVKVVHHAHAGENEPATPADVEAEAVAPEAADEAAAAGVEAEPAEGITSGDGSAAVEPVEDGGTSTAVEPLEDL